jgi:hypothetical protein
LNISFFNSTELFLLSLSFVTKGWQPNYAPENLAELYYQAELMLNSKFEKINAT